MKILAYVAAAAVVLFLVIYLKGSRRSEMAPQTEAAAIQSIQNDPIKKQAYDDVKKRLQEDLKNK